MFIILQIFSQHLRFEILANITWILPAYLVTCHGWTNRLRAKQIDGLYLFIMDDPWISGAPELKNHG